jgi:DNA-binding NtrC family response regulator
MSRKVLVVDIDEASREQCARVLRDCACQVRAVKSGEEGLALLEGNAFNTVLLDFHLAGQAAHDLLEAMRRVQPAINLVLMVNVIGNPAPQNPLHLRGYPILTKPLRIEDLTRVLEASAEEAGPSTKPAGGTTSAPVGFAGLVGTSERMKKIHRLISRVAMQRHSVLIMGESGTGKELVARAIHKSGPWKNEPFVPVDCGSLPPALIESELFGHAKGAFTGAAQSRQGLLASAGAGTVFLDEIGELPVELQSRLLRAIQEHEIRPVGSNTPVRFEARIVAATNQDLEAAMTRGSFRKDLFFRLNVVAIKMPPLRDRKEDIPELARHFLGRLGGEKTVRRISDGVLGRLMSYGWPGNVRELENCIQHAVSLGSGPFIQIQDLPSTMLYHLARKSASRADLSTIQALEQQAIRQALQATGGDRARAANLLGIGKTTIYRKLKEYGIA